ncbi:hypothetical protein FRC11_004340 [Ceratobasidium sp. 423]|nr:hypothetical protein FRC11_004340 [Ceratobasidium sp. 423]
MECHHFHLEDAPWENTGSSGVGRLQRPSSSIQSPYARGPPHPLVSLIPQTIPLLVAIEYVVQESGPSATPAPSGSTFVGRFSLLLGKLSPSTYKYDPREVELRKLREVEKDMERDADKAEERLATAEQRYAQVIEAIDATYEDAEGLAWFRKQSTWTEERVELLQKLDKARNEFKVNEAKHQEEQNELRRQIHKVEVKIAELKKKQAKEDRENALQGARNILRRN